MTLKTQKVNSFLLEVSLIIRWQYYPKSDLIPKHLFNVTEIFEANFDNIKSEDSSLVSNEVLRVLRHDLEDLGYVVETSKRKDDLIEVPVLFGLNGVVEKSFNADAFHPETGTVLEVEAGRAVDNNQFLKDLFQACMMQNTNYLIIAVRNEYRGSDDFLTITRFFETLYASGRLQLPLKGILLIGY